MNRDTVLIGVKLFVAVVSGVAIFLGLSNSCRFRGDSGANSNNSNTSDSNSKDGCQDDNASTKNESSRVCETLVGTLRNSQNSCRNAANFLSALSVVAEKSMILFGKLPDNSGYGGGWYGSGRCGYGSPGGNIRLRRKSPYIIEAVGDGDIYDDNYDNHYL